MVTLYHFTTISAGIYDKLRYAIDLQGEHIMVGQDRIPVRVLPADHPAFCFSTAAPSPSYWGWVERDPSVEAGIIIHLAPLVGIEMETSQDEMIVYVNVPSGYVDVGSAYAYKRAGGQALLAVEYGDTFSVTFADGETAGYQCVCDDGWPAIVRIETRSAA